MKKRNPITISIVIAVLLQVAIVPWAAWNGTLNWQTGPLHLFFTLPAGAFAIMFGVLFSIANRRPPGPEPTVERPRVDLKDEFWLTPSATVRRHTILGEQPSRQGAREESREAHILHG